MASSSELSDPASPQASPSPSDATSRRISGRVKHKPVLINTDPNASIVPNGGGKRKRDADMEEADDDIMDSEDSGPDGSDGDPDEEELKEQRRKLKKASTKPATKKARTPTPKTTNLPVRPAVNGVKKPPKPRRPRPKPNAVLDDEATGLFCKRPVVSYTRDASANESTSSRGIFSRPYSCCSRIRVDYAIRSAQCKRHV